MTDAGSTATPTVGASGAPTATASNVSVANHPRGKSAHGRGNLKFESPVNARVIGNIGHNYYETVWIAIAAGLCSFFSGAVVMAIMIYCIHGGDIHAILFSGAYHFFSAQAILALSYMNGWSTPMRWRHRKLVHIFLQLCAITCAAIGTAIVVVSRGRSGTCHGISGLLTIVLTVLTLMIGPFALKGTPKANVLHMTFGITCFFMSSLCLGTGILKEEFGKWAGLTVVEMLFAFAMFYTVVIVATTSMKCMRKM